MGLVVNTKDERILNGIKELELELDFNKFKETKINLEKGDEFRVTYDGTDFNVEYVKENNVYFALSFIFGVITSKQPIMPFKREFNGTIDTLTFMVDCSRNAVLKVDTVKRLIRFLSLMGYDSLMLYTEDTYEVEEYPYFGYLRNPYTKDELKEIDEYALKFNIELVPCIQTLAHFNSLIRHIPMGGLFDCNDILLVENDDTYRFIESLIKACREGFTSKKIHIGMDEAGMLGRGRYLDINGFKPRFELMCKHLAKVIEICKKYDFEPMMWSDMFVNIASSNESELEENKKMVPNNVELVYWDYYSMEEEHYSKYIKIHKRLDNKIGFAGGAWKWLGFSPDNRFSFVATKESMKAVNEEKISDYIVTGWGDNGAEASAYSILPSLLYASRCRYSLYDLDTEFKDQFEGISEMKFDDFMTIDLLNRTTRNDDPYERSCANKYLLYNDPLLGTLDTTISKDIKSIYTQNTEKIKEALKRSGKWKYIFTPQYELGQILSLKASLGVELRKAYKSNDKISLKYALKDISMILKYIEEFKKDYRTEWNKENKPNGIDVFDIRIGALIERLMITKSKVNDYLKGKIDSIPELEETLLDFLGNKDKYKEDYNQCEYRWRRMTSVNVNE